MVDEKCTCEELVDIVQEFIPMLLAFLSVFIFIVLVYRCYGKSRILYWFILAVLFLFDVATIGLSVEYPSALRHAFTCICDEEI